MLRKQKSEPYISGMRPQIIKPNHKTIVRGESANEVVKKE